MRKNFMVPCFGIFCALVASEAPEDPSELQISLKTLKSDLDWILEYPMTPLTVNLEYTKGAVIHMSVLSKPGDQPQKYIRFDETITLKLSTGSYVQLKDVVYANRTILGLPSDQELMATLIIVPDIQTEPKPAERSITYTSMRQLTKDLEEDTKDVKNSKYYPLTVFVWPYFEVGSSTTTVTYNNDHDYFIFQKPLKGISLHHDCHGFFQNLLGLKRDKSHSSIKSFSSSKFSAGSVSSDCDSPNGCERRADDVFYDVWYDPYKRRYGSSSGSMKCVDAVRIYDEWSKDVKEELAARTAAMEKAGSRGENLRKKVFEQDMNTAYQLIHGEHHPFSNVLINYADEIILDVRGHTDGDHQYVSATGIANTGARGGKPKHIRAFYDQDKLEYSDQTVPNTKFVEGNFEDKTSFIKYIDWSTFESHLKAVATAMQGKCAQDQKRIFDYTICYGDCIRVKYHCRSNTVTVTDTVLVLIEMKNIPKPPITKCKHVQYFTGLGIDSTCLSDGMTPVAVQLQLEEIVKYPKPLLINAAIFENEMKSLSRMLIKNGRAQDKKLTLGTILIDERLVVGMAIPKKVERSNSYVKVYGDFMQMTEFGKFKHQKLHYLHEAKFFTSIGDTVMMNDMFLSAGKFVLPSKKLETEYVIGWSYLSTGRLVHVYLRKVLEEALRRCGPRTAEKLRFELVHYGKFGLSGFCDCFEEVVLVEGTFRALLLSKTDRGTEVRSDRLFDDIIYIEKDHLLITGNCTNSEVFAISLPEITDLKQIRKTFGAPVEINAHSYIMFKS